MCGTYTLRADIDAINHAFNLSSDIHYPGSFKIAPSTLNPVITQQSDNNTLELMKWGFRPHWMTEEYMKTKKRYPFINARAETLFTTPAFRGAAKSARCMIIADGFYEPKGPKGTKNRPYYFFQFPDERLFAFAGVKTTFHEENVGPINNYAIITVPPNDEVAPVHDRMPLILDPDDYARWLDETTPTDELQTLLVPWAGDKLDSWGVSDYVKKRDAYGPDCIASIH